MVRPWLLTTSFVLPISQKEYTNYPVLDPLVDGVARLYGGELVGGQEAWMKRESDQIGPDHEDHTREQCAECRAVFSTAGRQLYFRFFTSTAADQAAKALILLAPVVSVSTRFLTSDEDDAIDVAEVEREPPRVLLN